MPFYISYTLNVRPSWLHEKPEIAGTYRWSALPITCDDSQWSYYCSIGTVEFTFYWTAQWGRKSPLAWERSLPQPQSPWLFLFNGYLYSVALLDVFYVSIFQRSKGLLYFSWKILLVKLQISYNMIIINKTKTRKIAIFYQRECGEGDFQIVKNVWHWQTLSICHVIDPLCFGVSTTVIVNNERMAVYLEPQVFSILWLLCHTVLSSCYTMGTKH